MTRSRRKPDSQEVPKRDLNAGQRAAVAIKLRAKGLTYEEVAVQAGYSGESAARKAILRELDRVVVTNADVLRKEEAHRLDRLLAAVWPQAVPDNPKDPSNLWAVDRVLKIIEARRQLFNLDIRPEDAAKAQVVVREVPSGYFGIPAPQEAQNGHSN